MNFKRDPESRMSRVLLRMAELDTMSLATFRKMLIDVAGDKTKAYGLRRELKKQGYIASEIAVTSKAKEAAGRIKS